MSNQKPPRPLGEVLHEAQSMKTLADFARVGAEFNTAAPAFMRRIHDEIEKPFIEAVGRALSDAAKARR